MIKRVLFILVLLLNTTDGYTAGGKYGFAAGGISQCNMWTLLFPVSFQVPDNNAPAEFNIIYVVDDNVKGMDDFSNFYTTPYNQLSWPMSPYAATGTDKPFCTKSMKCYNSGPGGVGYGVSGYDNVVAKYGATATRVLANAPNPDTTLSWFYIPVRKLKLLRIELFTPYTGTAAIHQGYVEPVSFEYTATGNKDEMRLTDMKSTATDQSYIILPSTFRPTQTLDIQVWLTRTSDAAYQGLTPQAHIDKIAENDPRMSQIPENCK